MLHYIIYYSQSFNDAVPIVMMV